MNSYVSLSLAALLPVIAAIFLYIIDKKTKFGNINPKIKNLLFGIVFGGLAIVGTEWGIPMNGAQVNCRDAAVLIGGLLFGGPVGIIAGLIGGIERYIAVAWGVGSFTQIACSVSTVIAGFYAALLRKYMFEDKKPGWLLSFAIGIVMEVFHLTMVFITNMSTPTKAMAVVKACTIPMVLANGVSVLIAAIVVSLLSGEHFFNKKSRVRISQTIQRWLLTVVLFAFFTTSVFVFFLQNEIAKTQADSLLSISLTSVAEDISDTSDQNLLSITKKIASELPADDLNALAEKYDVVEINLINGENYIVRSTDPANMYFDMSRGRQSVSFLSQFKHASEYVQSYGPIARDPKIYRKYAGVKTEYGILQVGYDAQHFQSDMHSILSTIAKNRHIGETGYIVVLNASKRIISAPKAILDKYSFLPSAVDDNFTPGKTFVMTINAESCLCRYQETEGYHIISVFPEAEAYQIRNISLYVNTFMEILVFAILFGLIYLLIKKVVVNQISDINRDLSKITEGDLGVVVNVRSNEEFASLSDDINSTVDTLKRYIAEASARIDKELEFAKSIQASALPSVFPKRHDLDIYASMSPAKEVGGDFYDFYLTGEDSFNFLIADVSGKGIPAAMFMMRAKAELKTLTESALPINEVFTRGNAALCEGNDAGMFVTAWQGGIDLNTGLVKFACAGHNPPLVRRNVGQFEYLKAKVGFVLAGMDSVVYKTQELQLEPGDILFLYTDGVTEATNANTELYGEDRLLRAINSKEFESMHELCTYIRADVDAFVGEAPQFDDITMVAFKFVGKPPVKSVHYDEASIDDIPKVTEFIEQSLEALDCPMKTVIQINIAIDEIYSNIVRYGYAKKPGPTTVTMVETDEPHGVKIEFIDEGVPYNPLTRDDPDITLSAEERNIGGLGIYMVKKSMDELKYRYEDGKNILTVIKHF